MHIKLIPDKEMNFKGRKVVQVICLENSDDKQLRIDTMHQASNHNRVSVVATHVDTGIKKIYTSMTSAGKELKIDPSQISKACKNNTKAGKYTWKKTKETL